MTHQQAAEEALIKTYKEIFQHKGNNPKWACKKMDKETLIHCAIPFVGKRYFEQPVKILVYASAENLTRYSGHLDDDNRAVNRHRIWLDESPKESECFPCVHIQPFNNGALTMVACHIMSRLAGVDNITPADFLENIAFANYGKYTIDPSSEKKNTDYAACQDKLLESQEYIRADIEILCPDYIIMIKQMYDGKGNQKAFIDSIKGNAKIIPIYQITPTTINNPRTFRRFPPAEKAHLHPTIQSWYKFFNAGAISSPYFLSVFSYLDSILDTIE